MITFAISSIFERDLKGFIEELNLYKTEEDIWKVPQGVLNSGGNLCLHICGNLNHFIGAVLGNTGYIRNRDKEFSTKHTPRAELIKEVESAIKTVSETLKKLSDDDLKKEYASLPVQLTSGKEKWTVAHFLLHLIAHMDYHHGQMNYHRRLVHNG